MQFLRRNEPINEFFHPSIPSIAGSMCSSSILRMVCSLALPRNNRSFNVSSRSAAFSVVRPVVRSRFCLQSFGWISGFSRSAGFSIFRSFGRSFVLSFSRSAGKSFGHVLGNLFVCAFMALVVCF